MLMQICLETGWRFRRLPACFFAGRKRNSFLCSSKTGKRMEIAMMELVEEKGLLLRKVTRSDLEAVREYRAEFLESGDSMDGCSNLRRYENMEEWYLWIQKIGNRNTCPSQWVQDTQFLSVRCSDNRIVGMLDIRHTLNEACRNLFGNIGYSVRRSERGKGYGTIQLEMAKKVCGSMGMDRILVSCHKENIVSAKIIRNNGGVLENETVDQRNGKVLQRYWIITEERRSAF